MGITKYVASAVIVVYKHACEDSLIFHLMAELELVCSVPLTRLHQNKGTDCAWPPPQSATVGAAAEVLKMNETLNLHGTTDTPTVANLSKMRLRRWAA